MTPIVSEQYRRSVAWVLMIVYALNFADRQILSVLLPQIQSEFSISDTAAGLLHGTAFAMFYVTLGIPIARWSDRGNRVRIISLAILIWGLMTALCGVARSVVELFLARIGVGVGEAGCSPAAYSILAGYFPPEKRSGAMAIYGAGIPVGAALGLGLGGFLAQILEWRHVFWVFGIPSMLMAAVCYLYIREPQRPPSMGVTQPSIRLVLGEMLKRRTIIHATAGTAVLAFTGFGAGAFTPSFLVRSHAMPIGLIGLALCFNLIVFAAPATIFAGRLADRWAARRPRIQMWLPAALITASAPFGIAALIVPIGAFQIAGLAVPTYVAVLLLMAIPMAANATYVGPVLAAVQGLVEDRVRATTVALFLFTTNFVGLGLGPVFVGWLSDLLQARAGAESLRYALVITSVGHLWTAFHFWRAGVSLVEDQRAAAAKAPGAAPAETSPHAVG